jgi:PadR family transcriptional regulator, regulatory protein PadR
MTRDTLGEFEKLVMLAVLRTGEDAYGARIIGELEERTGRSASAGAVYVALRRLEDKRMVRSRLGPGTPKRGGRPKRFYQVLPAGVAALREARQEWDAMLAGLEGRLAPES